MIWLAVHHKQKKALELFSREIAAAGTGMGMSVHPRSGTHVTQLVPLLTAHKQGVFSHTHTHTPPCEVCALLLWRSLTNALVLCLSSWTHWPGGWTTSSVSSGFGKRL